jgi:hypothetical protein
MSLNLGEWDGLFQAERSIGQNLVDEKRCFGLDRDGDGGGRHCKARVGFLYGSEGMLGVRRGARKGEMSAVGLRYCRTID